MPFRSGELLRTWVAEFESAHPPQNVTIRVIPQDGDEGADTGLVGVRLLNSPAEIYIEPPAVAEDEWIATFEPREEFVHLKTGQVVLMAEAVGELAAVCAFLQEKGRALAASRKG